MMRRVSRLVREALREACCDTHGRHPSGIGVICGWRGGKAPIYACGYGCKRCPCCRDGEAPEVHGGGGRRNDAQREHDRKRPCARTARRHATASPGLVTQTETAAAGRGQTRRERRGFDGCTMSRSDGGSALLLMQKLPKRQTVPRAVTATSRTGLRLGDW